jgi:hypothetical protein
MRHVASKPPGRGSGKPARPAFGAGAKRGLAAAIHAPGRNDLLNPRPAIKLNPLAQAPGERCFPIAAIQNEAIRFQPAQRLERPCIFKGG